MRQYAVIAVKATISVGLLYFALSRIDFRTIVERLNQIELSWGLFALALLAAQQLLTSIRWLVIVQQCNAELSLLRAFRLNLIAAFFNQVLPSTVGGDAVRIWLFAGGGVGWALATHSVLLDRFIGVLGLALLVLVGLPWSFQLIENPIGRVALLVIGCGCVGAGLTFVALGSRNWLWMQRFWPTRQIIQFSARALDLLTSPGRASLVIGLSILIHVMTAAVAWCVARAIVIPLELLPALLLMPPVLLVATVPISIAGWGVRESALMLAFAYAGLPEADGLLVSIAFGIVNLAIGILGGAIWFISKGSLSRKETLWPDQQAPSTRDL